MNMLRSYAFKGLFERNGLLEQDELDLLCPLTIVKGKNICIKSRYLFSYEINLIMKN